MVPHRDGPAGEVYPNAPRRSGDEPPHDDAVALRQLLDCYRYQRQMAAYEIHDGLVQYATGAVMQLEAYLQAHPESSPQLEAALALMRKTVEEGRHLIEGMRPPTLEKGLGAAVGQLLLEPSDGASVEADLGELGELPPVVELAAYRIVQEALTNARKHSRSQRIAVRLHRAGQALRIEVQDWGIGFDASEPAHTGHGLRGIAERTHLLGGRLDLTASPGRGTRLAVELPVALR